MNIFVCLFKEHQPRSLSVRRTWWPFWDGRLSPNSTPESACSLRSDTVCKTDKITQAAISLWRKQKWCFQFAYNFKLSEMFSKKRQFDWKFFNDGFSKNRLIIRRDPPYHTMAERIHYFLADVDFVWLHKRTLVLYNWLFPYTKEQDVN